MKLKLLTASILLITILFGIVYYGFRSKQSAQLQLPVALENQQREADWQEETVSEVGLRLEHPKDLVFRKEIADDDGRIRTVGFFLTRGVETDPEYQMYGLYQQFKEGTQQDLELAKREMDTSTIKEVTIDGYQGIVGLIIGPKTRYITTVLKGGKLFSVSTMPPTQENKELTEKILSTFDFR